MNAIRYTNEVYIYFKLISSLVFSYIYRFVEYIKKYAFSEVV
jgi:hypothetical protein